jgi:uncharacterized protein YdhG (YjbR/CyaY superfamily)
MAEKPRTVDEYIASFPAETQTVLLEVRKVIAAAVPGTTEAISYQMPTMVIGGKRLLHFAGWKSHISVYPVPAGDHEFNDQIAPYRGSKGTLKFPLNKPIPYEVIRRVAELLAERHRANTER